MGEASSGMTGLEWVFLTCAVMGGILFLIRLVMQFVGGDGGAEGEIDVGDVGGVADAGDAGEFGAESDVSFRLLSFQGLTGFFMMFGLVGLALIRESKAGTALSVLGALAAGLFTLWVIAKMFSMMRGLQSSGTIDMRNAVGEEGTVYLTIAPGGTGKAQITIQGHLKVFDAVAADKNEIRTGQHVKVVGLAGGNVLVVETV